MQLVIDIPDEDYYRIKYMPDAYKDREPRIYMTIRKGTPVSNDDLYIPYIMHKEMDIPLLECQKAYDIAIDYLRRQGKARG